MRLFSAVDRLRSGVGLLLTCVLTFTGTPLAPAAEGDLIPQAVVPASASVAFRGPTGAALLPDGALGTYEETVFVADPLSKSVTGVEVDGTLRGPWYGAGGELFVEPTDVACDLSGNVFVADKGRPYVYKLNAATGELVEKIGSGLVDAVGIDWLNDTGGAHKIFVADESGHRVVRFSHTSDTSAGAWYTAGAQLYRPMDVEAPFGTGVIWVTDAERDMVFCIDLLNDMPVYSWGESGTGAGKLTAPVGIAIRDDGSKDVVVSDAGGRVQRFTQGGVHVSTLVESGVARGAVSSPQRIALDIANNWFWVAERDTGRVQLFNENGGTPAEPSIRGGGRGTAWGEFDMPGALAVAGPWLLVCDTGNNRIQAIDINHDDPMHAFGSEGSGDGQFMHPGGIAVGPDGSVFVSDSLNHRIQKFTAGGDHVASWGSLGAGPGQFNEPKGIAVDSQGFIYVADTKNYRIVKLAPNGDLVTSWSSYEYRSATRNLWQLSDIAIGPEDHLFVYDGFNGRGGASSNYWVPEFKADGTLAEVHFDYTSGGLDGRWGGLAVGASRTIYLCENDFAWRPKIRMKAWQPAFFEGGYYERSDRGIAPGRFEMTGDVAIGPFGMLFVSDPALHRVQRLKVEDTTAPRTDFVGPGEGWTSDDSGVRILRPTDGLAGPLRTWLSVDGEEPYTIWQASEEATANPSRTVGVTKEGTTTVEFWAEDAFGNMEHKRSVPVKIDRYVPQATVAVSPSGWTTRNVEVSVSATDTGAGVSSIMWSMNRDGEPLTSPVTYENTVTVTDEGVTGVRFDVEDGSGKKTMRSDQAKIDRTAPVTTLTRLDYMASETQPGVQLWPTVTGTGAEMESGGVSTYWLVDDAEIPLPAPYLDLTVSGTYAVKYWAVDAAGNPESEQTTSVVVPTGGSGGGDPGGGDPPLGGFLIAGGRTWFNSRELTITSNVDGAIQMRFKAPGDTDWRPWVGYVAETVVMVDASQTDGDWTIRAQYRNGTDDTAVATDAQASIGVDRVPPTTTSNASESRSFTYPEPITFAPGDDRSGVAESWYRINGDAPVKNVTSVSLPPGTHRVRWWSVDAAGNIEGVHDRTGLVMLGEEEPGVDPPVGGFSIAGGRQWTNTGTLAITSNVSNAVQMRFKAPGDATWRGWTDYSQAHLLTVSGQSDGQWTVYAQYRNGTDDTAVSVNAQATIGVDRVPPTTTSNANEGRAFTRGEQIILVPSDDRSGLAGVRYRVGEGPEVQGQTVINLPPGTHRLRWWSVDNAGNTENTNDRSVTVLKDGVTLTGTSSNATIAFGGAYLLTGRASVGPNALAGKPVRLEYLDGGVWVDGGATVSTDGNGTFAFESKPTSRRTYRARFVEDAEYLGAETAPVIVTPKASIGAPVAPRTMYLGKAKVVYGALKPAHAAGTYPVRIYRYRYVGGKWKPYGYVKAKASDYAGASRYKASVKLPYKGKWKFQAVHLADAGHPLVKSGWRTVTVK